MISQIIKIKEIDSKLLMLRTNQFPFVERKLTKEDYEEMQILIDEKLLLLEDLQHSIDMLKVDTSAEKRNNNLKLYKQ